ncbi:hypothetical protein C8J56DRAFT_920394, partial [Mycena floridula]
KKKTPLKAASFPLLGAKDLVDFRIQNYGRPQPIIVTKNKKAIAVQDWNVKQKEARLFLRNIGFAETISQLVGPRYADLLRAIDGSAPFVALVSPSTEPQAAPGPSAASTSTVVGQKRKKPGVSHGPVIDLTND